MIRTKRYWLNVAIGMAFFLSMSLAIDAFNNHKDWSVQYFSTRFIVAFVFALAFGYLLSRRKSSSQP